jgi:dimethylargininase
MGRHGTALVRRPGPRLPEGIVTHVGRRPVDVGLARRQHDAYVAALDAHGWTPHAVAPADEHPDAVFVEDAVVVVADVALLTPSGAPERRGANAGAEAAARDVGLRVTRLAAPATLDGGDVLQVGRTVYVGLAAGGRTNADGVRALAGILEPLGRTVVPVALTGALHLKSAVTALPDGSLLGIPRCLDTTALPDLRVPPEDDGAHVVPLGGATVLLSAAAPRTAEWLDGLGFATVPVEISEFEKLEGCVTCLSVLCAATPPG